MGAEKSTVLIFQQFKPFVNTGVPPSAQWRSIPGPFTSPLSARADWPPLPLPFCLVSAMSGQYGRCMWQWISRNSLDSTGRTRCRTGSSNSIRSRRSVRVQPFHGGRDISSDVHRRAHRGDALYGKTRVDGEAFANNGLVFVCASSLNQRPNLLSADCLDDTLLEIE